MNSIQISDAGLPKEEAWNRFVDSSNEGTVFHRLDFLAYHGAKFKPYERHLVWSRGSEIIGVMPLAVVREVDGPVARSPYGASYGGPVFSRPPTYDESRLVVAGMIDCFASWDIERCSLTLPLACCYQEYSDTFRLALMEHGFACTRRDVSSVVPLGSSNGQFRVRSRARRMARKAEKAGVVISHRADTAHFWQVLERTFEKHGVPPTHTRLEYESLSRQFPDRIFADVAYLDDSPVAGVGYFVINNRVMASFYLCQDSLHQDAQGLSLLLCAGLERAANDGFQWFDLGTSSLHTEARPNIFRFKEGFGALGLFRETYVWTSDRQR